MGLKEVSVSLGLPFGLGSISGRWSPDEEERQAAWEMYVELVTRISVEPLGPQEGSMREALSSLYTLFATTREVLRRHGPTVATPKNGRELSFGQIAVTVLNRGLRPFLAKWNPALSHYENLRDEAVSPVEHERRWDQGEQFRSELSELRVAMSEYAELLAGVAGVPSLTMPQSPPLA